MGVKAKPQMDRSLDGSIPYSRLRFLHCTRDVFGPLGMGAVALPGFLTKILRVCLPDQPASQWDLRKMGDLRMELAGSSAMNTITDLYNAASTRRYKVTGKNIYLSKWITA